MKKRTLAGLFLSLSLAVGLVAGCGSSDTNSGEKGSEEEIKVGLNLELSGPVASYGSSIAEGIDLAIEEINNNGGINGKKINPIKFDNKSEASEATNGAIKLINQDKVVAILGAATSTNTLAQAQVAAENKVPIITPTGTNPDITSKDGNLNSFAFRTCFIDPFQGEVAANFASRDLGSKNAAIFIDNASDYAKGLASSFKEVYVKNGGTVVAEEAYIAKDTDFRATLTRIKSANPDFIFVPGYYEEVGLIVQQARALDIDVPIMGGDGWDSPILVELAGAAALNNTYITNHYSSGNTDDAKIQSFVETFKGKYNGKTPDAFNALGYDTVYFLANAIERAASTSAEDIQKALAETENLALVSGILTLDENHNPVKSATILEFVDGEQQFKAIVNP